MRKTKSDIFWKKMKCSPTKKKVVEFIENLKQKGYLRDERVIVEYGGKRAKRAYLTLTIEGAKKAGVCISCFEEIKKDDRVITVYDSYRDEELEMYGIMGIWRGYSIHQRCMSKEIELPWDEEISKEFFAATADSPQ